MKRKWIMLVSGVLCLCLLSGCGGETVDAPSDESEGHSVLANEQIEIMMDVSESAVETEPDAESTSQGEQNVSKNPASKTPSNQTTVKSPLHSPTNNPEQPSAQEPANLPADDKAREYQQKIEEENERHEKVIEDEKAYCERNIASMENQIDDLRWEHDVYNGSYESYIREVDQLDSEISKIQNRIALLSRDTSGIYQREVEQLQEELDGLFEEQKTLKLSWLIKDQIEGLENEIELQTANSAQRIREENELHEKNIQEINQQYGM